MATDLSSVFTIEDLAKYLKISKSTLYQLAQRGKLPGVKVGRHWRFHREAIDTWLKGHIQRRGCTGKRENRGT